VATIHKLSARAVATAKRPGWLADGGGLFLQVTIGVDGKPRRSWIFRFTAPDGRRREMGMGSTYKVSLSQARHAAHAARKQLGANVDPIDARFAGRAAAKVARATVMTFEDCAIAYIEAHAPSWKNQRHRTQWRNTLKTFAFPVIGAKPVHHVDVTAIMRVVEPIWCDKHETARRLLGRVEAILDWAAIRGYRTGENPARWRGHLEKALPSIKKAVRVGHHRALPHGELPNFMARLSEQNGISARALEFCILTATRTSETLGARWSEFDLEAGLWIIPANRMKVPREHRVPLSQRALMALSENASKVTDTEFVFPNPNSGAALSNMALLATLKRMGRDDLTVHGFRSTFRDWAAEQTDFAREVAEAALAHSIGSAVEAAYRRGDLFCKRKALMTAWAAHCSARAPEFPASTGMGATDDTRTTAEAVRA
jgi:integrase